MLAGLKKEEIICVFEAASLAESFYMRNILQLIRDQATLGRMYIMAYDFPQIEYLRKDVIENLQSLGFQVRYNNNPQWIELQVQEISWNR